MCQVLAQMNCYKWPKIPGQDMSRKHKVGWEEMAMNVVMISLKRLEKP